MPLTLRFQLARKAAARLAIGGGCVFLWLTGVAMGFDEFSYDLRLIAALTEAKMTDYAFAQVERILKLYPDKKDLILLAKARVHYELGQRADGNKILAEIDRGSPFFADSRLLQAEMAFKRSDFKVASEAFDGYFSTSPKPLSDSRADAEEFLQRVFMYVRTEIELGNPLGAVKAVGYAEVLKGDAALSKEQLDYQKGRVALAACDKALDLKLPVDTNLITQVIGRLEKIQFATADYLVTMNSLISVAHGHVLLGDLAAGERKLKEAGQSYEKALQVLRSLSELLAGVKDQVAAKDSPLAGAFFQYGRAMKGQARVVAQTDRDLAARRLRAALRYFERVKEEFAASDYGTPALIEFGKTATLIETLTGEKVDTGGADDGSIMLLTEQADKFFSAKDFAKAVPLYLQALQAGRLSRRFAPPTGLRLTVAYAELDQMLEAQTIASYLGDVFPNASETADALVQVGAAYFKRSQAATTPAAKDALLDAATRTWDQFVEIAPGHANASEIAFVVAENEFRKASLVAQASLEEKDRDRREELKSQARDLFRQAIPKYERLLEVFGGTARGIRANYRLALIYEGLDEAIPAAEAFLAYSRLETNPAMRDDRLDAKFRAGSQLMFSKNPAEAIPVFQELLEWVAPGNREGIDIDSEKAVRVKEDASSYLGWSYDLAAEAMRPQMDDIRAAIGIAQEAIKAAGTNTARLAAEAKAIDEWLAVLSKETQARLDDLNRPLPTPEADALREKLPAGALDSWTEQERRIELPRRQAEAAELARQFIATRIQGAIGEKTQNEAASREAFAKLQAANQALTTAQEHVRTYQNQLEAFEDELSFLDDEAKKVVGVYEQAVERIETVTAEVEALNEQLAAARRQFDTGSEAEKAEARETGNQLRIQLRATQQTLLEARRAVDELNAPDRRLARRRAEREATAMASRVETTKERLAAAQRDVAVATAEAALFGAQVKALNSSIAFTDQLVALLRLTEAQRNQPATVEAWKTAQASTIAQFTEVAAAAEAKAELLRAYLAADKQAMATEVVKAEQQIGQLQTELAPLRQAFEKLKRQGQVAFEAFLAAYPQSRHVPDNMARVGTIFIEFNDFTKAEKYLNELTARFPDHRAAQQANFNLAKVQFEIGKPEEAAVAFRAVVANLADQPAANLNYLVRAMADTAHSELAVAASDELLRRSEDVNHEDYDRLAGRPRENLLFRAGQAALQGQNYKKAADYFDTLLKENPRTANFFAANIFKARALRLMSPPDLAAARWTLLDQVRRFAQDNTVINETLVELAEVFIAEDNGPAIMRALTQLGQIVLVSDGELVLLADDAEAVNRPFIERAYLLAAQCYSLIGDETSKQLVVADYRQRYPNGAYRDAIGSLPAAKFTQPAPRAAN